MAEKSRISPLFEKTAFISTQLLHTYIHRSFITVSKSSSLPKEAH